MLYTFLTVTYWDQSCGASQVLSSVPPCEALNAEPASDPGVGPGFGRWGGGPNPIGPTTQ